MQGLFAAVLGRFHRLQLAFSSAFRPAGLHDLLDWMSFLSPFVDWSALAIPLNGDFSICWAKGLRLSSAFRSVLLFFSLFGVFVDLLSFFRCGVSFLSFLVFSQPSQSKNVTPGAYRYQEGCSVSAQFGATFFFFFERTAFRSV